LLSASLGRFAARCQRLVRAAALTLREASVYP